MCTYVLYVPSLKKHSSSHFKNLIKHFFYLRMHLHIKEGFDFACQQYVLFLFQFIKQQYIDYAEFKYLQTLYNISLCNFYISH